MNKKKRNRVLGLLIIMVAAGVFGVHWYAQKQSAKDGESQQGISVYHVDSVQPIAQKRGQAHGGASSTSSQLTGKGVTMIGDSVTVGVAPYLKEQMPDITVDGKVGRQMSQAGKVLRELAAQGNLGDRVIIELGTNGPFSKDQLRSVLQTLSNAKQVLLVTTRVPRGWQDTVNDTMEQTASEFKNVQVVDWYAASQGKDQFFYKDGIHLKPDGSRYYTSLLVQALKS
ncbi:hypothetical protein [Paenibacillus bovis]|uniref:Acyltransferase n=1 Tax=Paenibacillus bovis TaxID=1616788 RepID=A0A172ZHQ3_9BACL|nr:hypothetical protein [Paenibacillus bovis]ANF97063.1 hypothetical protein AR543_14325 [Paenibacillus bovis]